jgi:hypothetical protein
MHEVMTRLKTLHTSPTIIPVCSPKTNKKETKADRRGYITPEPIHSFKVAS